MFWNKISQILIKYSLNLISISDEMTSRSKKKGLFSELLWCIKLLKKGAPFTKRRKNCDIFFIIRILTAIFHGISKRLSDYIQEKKKVSFD